MRVLSCVMIIVESSKVLMASQMFRCTKDELMTELGFSGHISRVNLCDEYVVGKSFGGCVFNTMVAGRVFSLPS